MEFKVYKNEDVEMQIYAIEEFIEPVSNFKEAALFMVSHSTSDVVDLQALTDGEITLAKYWLADDKQSDIGFWSIDTSDEEIWEILKSQGHDGTGKIETCLVEPHEIAWDKKHSPRFIGFFSCNQK